jgi:hypothetical protein
VSDAETFVRELVGANATFAIDQITDQLRDLVVARFSDLLGEKSIPILELAANYRELGDQAATHLVPELARYGLELTQLVVESIALPDEVAATLDQRTRIGLIGDVSAYAQLQAADAIRDAARNQGSGGAGAAIGVGIAMAQQLGGAAGAAMRPTMNPTVVTPVVNRPQVPPPIPQLPAFFLAIDGKPVGPLDRAALAQRAKDGSLRDDTLVWRDGMAEWAAASKVPEMVELLSLARASRQN